MDDFQLIQQLPQRHGSPGARSGAARQALAAPPTIPRPSSCSLSSLLAHDSRADGVSTQDLAQHGRL